MTKPTSDQINFQNSVALPQSLTVDGTTLVVDGTNNRVGIGVAAPTTALDVAGNALITGNATVTGNATINGTISGSTVGALAASLLPSGSVLQVVVGAENGTALSLSSGYQAAAVTVSITPKRASSRIVLIASVNTAINAASGGGTFVNLYIYKTAIGTSVGGGANFNYATASSFSQHNGIIIGTDLPNTTSAMTYGIAANFSGTTPTSSYVNGNAGTSRIVAIEVAV